MSGTAPLDRLLDAWSDGTATETEVAELGARLAGDVRAARIAARHFTLEDGLREGCGRPAAVLARRPRRPASRRRWWPGPVAAIAAAALVALIWWRWPDMAGRDTGLPLLVGEALVDDEPWNGRGPLPPGALIQTRTATTLTYPDGTRFALEPGSRLRLDTVGMTTGDLLMDGRFTAQVARQPAGHPRYLRTGEARIEVLGTRFTLSRIHGRTDVAVEEGRVRFTRSVDGSSEELTAGGSAHAHWSSLHGTLVPWQATWDWRLDLPTDDTWLTAPAVSDGWQRGPAPIGCDSDLATVWGTLVPTRKNQRAPLVFRARHDFQLAGDAMPDRLRLRLEVDDGLVVWLNGVECLRLNLPAGPLSAGTNALTRVSGGYLEHVCSVDPTLLKPGANILAVQVHQYGTRSGDLAFALELVAP